MNSLPSNLNNNYKHFKYGQFDNFNNFVHYFNEIDFVYNKNEECSQRLNELPFKLCIKTNDNANDDILLYFEKEQQQQQQEAEEQDTESLYLLKPYINNQLETILLSFNDRNNWNEITINNNEIEKCAYLLSSKVCLKKNENMIKASIRWQLGNMPN